MPEVIHYSRPSRWLAYDHSVLMTPLAEAKAAVMALTGVPYRRAWAEKLQEIQLKQEVAGTSRIEGAEFTENELNAALAGTTPQELMTRSQKQAAAATTAYRWIASQPTSRPIDADLIRDIHRRIVTGCDDDHCEPGVTRHDGQNVVFGSPRHRGVEGGTECGRAFDALSDAINGEFGAHDILIQALGIHYHIGAMHPFLDGNGRTARATEALMLRRAGLKDALFISVSNYYYDEKAAYLTHLAEVRTKGGDMTEFLAFGLRGIALQCRRLLGEINNHISRALFRDTAQELFERLQSPKKRLLAKRQMAILNYLLERGRTDVNELFRDLNHVHHGLKEPWAAFVRDILALNQLKAVAFETTTTGGAAKLFVGARLQWSTEITETDFFREMQNLPKAKTFDFLHKSVGPHLPAAF